jgi:hypothetical protein
MPPPSYRRDGDDAHRGPPPAPRWVKRLGLVALVLVVIFALLHLTGRGFGPHMHMHGAAAEGAVPAGGGQ